MQSNDSPLSMFPRKLRLPRSKRGIALVIVLAILVLITGLVVAFFSSITNELTAAKSYAGGNSGKQLADAATQLAIGTIRKATSQTKDGSGTDVAWASQPGMIRTWDNTGTPLTCYKLFSSDNLEVPTPAGGYTNTADPNDFNKQFDSSPAFFTDLNAPVFDASNTPHYPIVDPRAALSATETSLSPTQIQGFSIDTTQVPAVTSVTYNPAVAYAPMPVRWMYVLQDGTLSVPTGTGKTATFSGTNVPTTANPIVGRIAYWTDDDSCKVNINTASEGVYWDVPHLLSKEDVGLWRGVGSTPSTPGLSICQPALGEYQRYPGHPRHDQPQSDLGLRNYPFVVDAVASLYRDIRQFYYFHQFI